MDNKENKTNNFVFMPVKINYYKGRQEFIVKKAFKSEELCMKYFDEEHRKLKSSHCGTILCDYCNAPWKIKNGEYIKTVDHDGVIVDYKCVKLELYS